MICLPSILRRNVKRKVRGRGKTTGSYITKDKRFRGGLKAMGNRKFKKYSGYGYNFKNAKDDEKEKE